MTRITTTSPPHGNFLYSRKSTEADDRQVLSINSQIDEMSAIGKRERIPIVEVLSEARSAKEPGRPVFNEMMKRLEAGQAQGILCWKLDRLARNPVDGGRLIWAVKQQGIRIITPTQIYSREDDNMILMYIEFGMAHKYVDDLSRVVKRGLMAKAKLGWLPNGAPIGYLNQDNRQTGHKEVIKDPDRFPLVRRMWDLMLAGAQSPKKIRSIVNDELGLRTRLGRPLSRSEVYFILANPFYMGTFEYPRGSRQWFKGKHEPMITEAEFDTVQALLGTKGRPRAVTRTFAYTGFIHCSGCGAMVTAEEKRQIICGSCRYKFVHRGKEQCPQCGTSIQAMLDGETARPPKLLHYVYYHCTKRKDPGCRERAVRVEQLEGDLALYLERIDVSEPFQRWVLERLRRAHGEEVAGRKAILESREKAYRACLAQLDNLVQLKTAPENADGSLLTNEEYVRRRQTLLKEKDRLEQILVDTGQRISQWVDLVDEVFEFTRQARTWLKDADPEAKRLLLAVFAVDGSNLTLSGRKLTIDAPKPFPVLTSSVANIQAAHARFEPTKNGSTQGAKATFGTGLSPLLRQLDDARTNKLMKSSPLRPPDTARSYGKPGQQLVQALREWLETTSDGELGALRHRIRAFFEKIKQRQLVA